MKTDAIIGKTGFVGRHLIAQHDFQSQFNRSNISTSAEKEFDTLVCAAAPGSMFEANKYPERDKEKMLELIEYLRKIKAKTFVLISSIAVLKDFAGKDDENTKNFQTELAYGRNRRLLEEFCQQHFNTCLIVRLPALFGKGLKKNFIFDLLNLSPTMLTREKIELANAAFPSSLNELLSRVYMWNDDISMFQIDRQALEDSGDKDLLEEALLKNNMSAIQFTHPDTTYQYYNMEYLWDDIQTCLSNNLKTIHLTSEPIKASDIFFELTGEKMPTTQAKIHHENMHSSFSQHWEQNGPYLRDKMSTISSLKKFFTEEKVTV